MQSGGEFADHELVKLASKVVDGVSRPPSTPFEKILVLYDKMKGVKNERKLTAKEQRIFDRVDAVVQQEFDAMFRRAEPMLKSIEKRPGSQSGGQEKPEAEVKAAAAAKPEVKAAEAGTGPKAEVKAEVKAAEAGTEVKAAKPDVNPAAAAPSNTLLAAAAAANPETVAAAAVPAKTQDPAATTMAASSADEGGGTLFMNSNRFIAVVWQGLKGIWEWIKSFFVGTMDEKMKEFMKIFNPAYLMSMIGNTAKDIEKVDSAVKDSIENLQRTVVSGISGAASASVDMVLNAFSMMPAFGTVLLVWRMFQNLLVIMGATLSVQAGKNELTGAVFNASPNQGTAAANAKEVSEAKPGDSDLKPGTQPVESNAKSTVETPAATAAQGQGQGPAQPVGGGGRAGRRRVSSSMTKKIKFETHRLKKSLKRYLHLRVPRVMPGGGGGGGTAFKSGYAAL